MVEHSPHPDREDPRLDLTVAHLWRVERISCPHRDLLRAYREGSLAPEEADYLRFHLENVGCPFCQANLEDLALAEDMARRSLREAVDEACRRLQESSRRLRETLRGDPPDA